MQNLTSYRERVLSLSSVGRVGSLAILLLALVRPLSAASTGTTALHTPQGSGAATANGDYVTGGINALYRYFIEVPPGLGRLTVELFDPDIGGGGAAEAAAGRDRDRNGFDTQADYTLIRPDGSTAATLNNCDDNTCADNAWVVLLNSTSAQNTAAGHWELRVDMTSAATGGDDINALGIRAHDGTSGAGGTELRVYYNAQVSVGVNPPGSGTTSRSYTFYPYITSGCTASKNDFDFDSNRGNTGSIALSSRTGTFAQNYASTSLSGDDAWRRDSWSGWTSDQLATDYGIWSETRTITSYLVGGTPNGNYSVVWFGNSQAAANPPANNNPTANAFRVYLPSDAGTAPVKPYVEQLLTFKSGTNPVPVGQTGIFQVTVRVVNPTPQSIAFSAANLVTANVPGAGATYNGNAAAGQGSIVSQPAVGGTGNITWNPGTLAAGATSILTYQVRVSPTSAGQRIVVTGTPASNGTQARFVDETGNTTQTRATFTFGPLCELATTQGVLTEALVRSFTTYRGERGGVEVEWETASEAGTAGFYLYRWSRTARRYTQVEVPFLAGLQGAPQGGRYRVLDRAAEPGVAERYVLEEVEANGGRRRFGPFVRRALEERPRADAEGAEKRAAWMLEESAEVRGERERVEDAGMDPRRLAHPAPGRSGADEHPDGLAPALGSEVSERAFGRTDADDDGAAVHLSVRETGLYRISAAEIAGWLGLDLKKAQKRIDEGKLALSQGGVPVAWYPDVRASGDRTPQGIYFYGQANDGLYSDTTAYKLERRPGLRMENVAATAATPAPLGSFAEARHVERDAFAATVLPLDPESDYWFWEFLQGGDPSFGRRTFTLDAPGLVGDGAGTLQVSLQGATATGVTGEHRVAVSLNGTALGQLEWQGIEPRGATFSIPTGTLRESGNQVDLTASIGGGAPYSITYLDSFDLGYRRALRAEGEVLTFGAEGAGPLTVTGFSGSDLRALDVRDPKRPRWLSGLAVANDGAGFRASFTGQAGARYLVAAGGAFRSVAAVRPWSPPALRTTGHRATYLVVAPAAWRSAAEGLAALRRAQGLPAEVVDLDQIADEFNAGSPSPDALRTFLAWARKNWQFPPRYVALAGGGTLDYRDRLGLHDNFVPPLLVRTPDGLFPSDNRLGDGDGDGLPEVAVGRLPVASTAELSDYVAKLAAFEAAPSAEWTGRALLLSDAADRSADFAAESEALAAQLPGPLQAERISLSALPLGEARDRFFGALASGVAWINYLGHGGLDRLAAGGLLANADVPGLANSSRLPVLTAMTCTVNRFAVPGVPALGELLVTRSGGGAIAVWGPTGLSGHAEAKLLAERFYRTVGEPEGVRLGDRVLRAITEFRALGGAPALPELYELLGDPALRLKALPVTPPVGGGAPSEE